MATLIVDIVDNGNAQGIADALRLMKDVVKITMKEEKTTSKWEEAIAEGAISTKECHAILENEIQHNW